ncbi:MAG: amino acid adenylation domain-containing protein [Acidobacteriota bacterium]
MNISNRLTHLSPDKRHLLSLLMKEKSLGGWLLPLARQHRDGNMAPASFSQRRMWFLNKLLPTDPTFNMPGAYQFKGKFDLDAFSRSVDEIVRRQEILRTTFVSVNDEPMQLIAEPHHVEVPLIDFSSLPPTERDAEAQRITEEEAVRCFDLEAGPLLRIVLLRLSKSEHIVLLTMHHIISDGWSMGVMMNEVSATYNAYLHGEAHSLPELPIQYADYAIWQRDFLQGETIDRQLAYWKKQLAGAPPLIELPTDHPRAAVRSARGGTYTMALKPEISEALRQLCRQEEMTLFMASLAVFKVLLYRYARHSHIVVGSSVAGRNRKETEGLIGFFVNSLVLHTELSDTMTFRQLLGRVKEVTLGAFANQDLPFERLVEEFRSERSLSHTPLFQVYFSLQNTPRSKKELTGVTTDSLGEFRLTAQYDLMLDMMEVGDRIGGFFEYNLDLFDPPTIKRMARHFHNLLAAAVSAPDQLISRLPLLEESEQRQLLEEWNQPAVASSTEICLHQLFEAAAHRTPDAVAVSYEDEELSYRELNARANQLAHYLRKAGVGPEVLVGVCVERSVEMITGLLGVLKAGGAYVPLDPAYPDDRIKFALEDAGVKALLTQSSLAHRFSDGERQLICLDSEAEKFAGESTENPAPLAVGNNAAYLIYTSGSTGKPKGAIVTHANVLDLFATTQPTYRFDERDVWTMFHSYAFDFSVWEIWGPLLYGGRLIVVPYLVSRSPESFWELLCEKQVTVLNQTPSAFRQLIEAQPLNEETNLRLIIFGGEALDPQMLQPWFDRYGDQQPQVFNMYGITETTVHVTWQLMRQEELNQMTGSIIGQSLNSLQTYILDQSMQLVPAIVAGELYVGGSGLARGYHGRADLTAERFVPDPFSRIPGARLYKSGDLGRFLATGQMEYLGRIDQQVKIRGFRIELGEIESVIEKHPRVKETVVTAYEGAGGDKRLAAYVVADSEWASCASELRQFLGDWLPAYMIPAIIVQLDQMPLTTNGKIDRRALPSPNRLESSIGNYQPPRDALEMSLARVFEEALNIRPVGVKGNFFELGGHSLLAVRLTGLLERDLGRRLPVAVIFQNASVESLAAVLRDNQEFTPNSSLVQLQPSGSKRPLFFIHAVGGGAFSYIELANRLGRDQPFYAFQAKGLYDKRTPHTSIKDMAADYLAQMRTVQPDGPYLLGGWSMGGAVAFEMAQQLKEQAEQVNLLVMIDSFPSSQIDWSYTNNHEGLLAEFAQNLGLSPDRISAWRNETLELETEKRLARLLELAASDGAIPPDIGLDDFQAIFNVYKSNLAALRNYSPEPLASPILLLKASNAVKTADPTRGWGSVAASGIEIRETPGDHFTALREPNVSVLAENLKSFLDEAD